MEIEVGVKETSEYTGDQMFTDLPIYVSDDVIEKLVDRYFEIKRKREILDE